MNFTFGIVTEYEDPNRIDDMINSIRNLKIPNYEIIVVGDRSYPPSFDTIYVNVGADNVYLSNKNNKIIELARYEAIIIMHDYFTFDPEWYEGFILFGNDWDVCSNPQYLINGKRHFTDWVIWDHPIYPQYYSLDYDDWSQTKYMYQSGGYYIAKKDFFKKFPFKQNLKWGEGEDVEWSIRMRKHAKWKCNKLSIVRHNKAHRDAR